jgi:hypothetical protein
MLLWVGCMSGSMACVFPQDDQVIPDRPPVANRPVRLIPGSARPEQREPPPIRIGANCSSDAAEFSIRASDPDLDNNIRANWYIDPNERYFPTANQPELRGNSGVRIAGSDVRIITSPSSLRSSLQQFADGRKHRVEVVVTDGEFIESQVTDPVTGETRPFLDVNRDPIRNADGVFAVEAYRDDYVWLVEVSTTPCP